MGRCAKLQHSYHCLLSLFQFSSFIVSFINFFCFFFNLLPVMEKSGANSTLDCGMADSQSNSPTPTTLSFTICRLFQVIWSILTFLDAKLLCICLPSTPFVLSLADDSRKVGTSTSIQNVRFQAVQHLTFHTMAAWIRFDGSAE